MAVVIAFQSKNEQVEEPVFTQYTKAPTKSPLWDEVEGGIHLPTGLIADANFEMVVNNCTACHSADIIRQSKLTADGW
jgi:hypothetical protein